MGGGQCLLDSGSCLVDVGIWLVDVLSLFAGELWKLSVGCCNVVGARWKFAGGQCLLDSIIISCLVEVGSWLVDSGNWVVRGQRQLDSGN